MAQVTAANRENGHPDRSNWAEKQSKKREKVWIQRTLTEHEIFRPDLPDEAKRSISWFDSSRSTKKQKTKRILSRNMTYRFTTNTNQLRHLFLYLCPPLLTTNHLNTRDYLVVSLDPFSCSSSIYLTTNATNLMGWTHSLIWLHPHQLYLQQH